MDKQAAKRVLGTRADTHTHTHTHTHTQDYNNRLAQAESNMSARVDEQKQQGKVGFWLRAHLLASSEWICDSWLSSPLMIPLPAVACFLRNRAFFP